MLSNVNLESALGKHIGIYPLKQNNIEGASIDLTASKFAFSVKGKCSIVKDNVITISPGDTAIVFSEEYISLDNRYAGSCLNRISFSMKGLLHASSPLKPNYTGRFSVTLYNASHETITLSVGDPVVVVMFQRLDRKATVTKGNGNGSRFDLLQSMGIIVEDERTRTAITEFDDRTKLFQMMKEQTDYKKIYNKRIKKRIKIGALLLAIAVGIGVFFAFGQSANVVDTIKRILEATIAGLLSGILVMFFQRFFKER